ncbi:MAG: cadherin-like domain-containing protein [Rhodospirillales bacterium]|nr:cadherin-like domain-containing protein [Rhodospirillales bacterium]
MIVTLQGVNDAPIANDDSQIVGEDAIVDLALLANDQDPDRNDALRVARINGQTLTAGTPVALASGALVLLTTDGRFQFIPNGAYDQLQLTQSAITSFAYSVSDGQSGFADATVVLTIEGANDAPEAVADNINANEDEALTLSVSALLANDRDPDAGDTLRITEIQGIGIVLDGTTLTYDPGDRYHFLAGGEQVTETLRYKIVDTQGSESEGSVTVNIEGRNDAPNASPDVVTTAEGQAVVLDPLANDTDLDAGDLERLSILSIDTTGTVGNVTLNSDGTIRYDPAGRFAELSGGQTAVDQFSYTIGDGNGGTDTTTVTVTIEGRNSLEQIVQSFEPPFFFVVNDPSIERINSFTSVTSGYIEPDVTPRRSYTPTDGDAMVRIEAGGSPITSVGSFLGLDAEAIRTDFVDQDGSLPAFGSAMKLLIDVQAGDEISFDWMFDARDYVNNPPDGRADNDFALLVIGEGDTSGVYKLADVRETGDLGATGWRSTVYTAENTGTLTIGLSSINDRVSDFSDRPGGAPPSQNSILLVDNIRINREFEESYQVAQVSSDGRLETLVHQV